MIIGLETLPCRFRAPYAFRLRLDRIPTPAGDPVELVERVWTVAQHWEWLEWMAGKNEYGAYVTAMTILECQPIQPEYVTGAARP